LIKILNPTGRPELDNGSNLLSVVLYDSCSPAKSPSSKYLESGTSSNRNRALNSLRAGDESKEMRVRASRQDKLLIGDLLTCDISNPNNKQLV
jgi:hypothetical protein